MLGWSLLGFLLNTNTFIFFTFIGKPHSSLFSFQTVIKFCSCFSVSANTAVSLVYLILFSIIPFMPVPSCMFCIELVVMCSEYPSNMIGELINPCLTPPRILNKLIFSWSVFTHASWFHYMFITVISWLSSHMPFGNPQNIHIDLFIILDIFLLKLWDHIVLSESERPFKIHIKLIQMFFAFCFHTVVFILFFAFQGFVVFGDWY